MISVQKGVSVGATSEVFSSIYKLYLFPSAGDTCCLGVESMYWARKPG